MDQDSIAFPKGAVACAPGDYLVCRRSGAGWLVYRVEDLLLVKRLLPRLTTPPTLILEEVLLDSKTPAYFNEVQLLLTSFAPQFADETDALRAIDRQALTEQ
ncbi:MAG TPA: hypothetical protein VJB15_09215, partial [Rhodothermia bacterium]|nr:hypothetical protein [Rhodothermia bacterium]